MNLNLHQSPPTEGQEAVWPAVIQYTQFHYSEGKLAGMLEAVLQDMAERNALGTERYGTTLQTFNGRNALLDAYQEILDSIVYLAQGVLEGAAGVGMNGLVLTTLLDAQIEAALRLRRIIGGDV